MESSKVVIEVVRTETIKPLTPTPDHLKKFGMSELDHFAPNYYMPIVFFYPASGELSVADRNRRLKESLSKTLARFYPVAGRIVKEGAYVDCDDGGVDFVETKVNGCGLSDILGRPDNEVLCKLLPCDRTTGGPDRLMRVQSNSFECGGTAVGACFLHLAMDACGRNAFLKEWAAAARGDAERPPLPDLGAAASRFPADPSAGFSDPRVSSGGAQRRFVFDGVKISSLRDRATGASGVRPTRVEAVTAFIYKCMVNALTGQLGHETKPSIAFQSVNLRSKFDPPLPEISLCNMVGMVHADSGDQNELVNDLPSTIAQFKKRIIDLTHECATKFSTTDDERTELWKNDRDKYYFSSMCGFGSYKLDFGWGMPIWISIAGSRVNNSVILIDAREGSGIEAWITLHEEHMALFETNADFLKFASLNSPISLF